MNSLVIPCLVAFCSLLDRILKEKSNYPKSFDPPFWVSNGPLSIFFIVLFNVLNIQKEKAMVDVFIPIVSNMRYFIKIITTLFLFKGSCVQLKFNQDLLVLKLLWLPLASTLYLCIMIRNHIQYLHKDTHYIPPPSSTASMELICSIGGAPCKDQSHRPLTSTSTFLTLDRQSRANDMIIDEQNAQVHKQFNCRESKFLLGMATEKEHALNSMINIVVLWLTDESKLQH